MRKLTIAAAICMSSTASWALDVCGALTVDTVWSAAQSPINITCNSVLLTGKTLTIDPGVQVRANAGVSLAIRGSLVAKGSTKKKIIFDSASPDQKWQGIALATNLGATAVIENATISNANAAVSVECCWGNLNPATITSVRFYKNRNAIAGYAGSKIIVRKAEFIENEVAIDSADKDIYDSYFQGNTYGLNGTERVNVYRSRFFQNGVALNGGRGKLQGSLIHSNTAGVQAFFEGFIMSGNSIYDNGTGVTLGSYDSTVQPFNKNNIYGNTGFALVNTTVRDQDATSNWWGTTDRGVISAGIYDVIDDVSRGYVNFEPIAATRILSSTQIAADKTAATEGKTFNITVELRELSAIQASVGVAVSGTAVAGKDYDPASIPASITFKPGEYTKRFTVVTFDNTQDQANRKLTLTLTNHANATPSEANQVSLTIRDDD